MDGGRSGNYGRGGGRGGNNRPRGSGGRGSQSQQRPQAQGQWPEQPPRQGVGRGSGGRGSQYQQRPQAQGEWIEQPPQQQGVGRGAGGGRTGADRPWGQPPTRSPLPVQSPARPPPPSLSSDELDIQSLKISPQQSLSPRPLPSEGDDNCIQPIRRPDRGGQKSVRSIKLVVNHFPVNFDPRRNIFHYDVDVKPLVSDDSRPVRKTVTKPVLRLIRDKLCSDHPDTFPLLQTAYDGEKNIFSALELPTGQYKVELSDGENARRLSYSVTIKFVKELKLCKLKEYLRGELSNIPRDILQGMDLVMKEHPSRQRICVGKSFYSDYKDGDDLFNGVAVYRGFNQSLKSTSQGLSLCLDYSVLAFRKPMSVPDFLMENIPQIKSIDDVKWNIRLVIKALKGLKVKVTHRPCKQKYSIVGLAEKDTCQSSFDLIDREGKNPPRRTSLVAYFQEKWGRKIVNLNIPCLQLGRGNKSADEVPMEFCVLVEGQVYPKENLDNQRAKYLKDSSIVKPGDRRWEINEMVQASDGPCGGVIISNFGIQVDKNMTKVEGRVIGAPELRIGGSQRVKVDGEKCQWNLTGNRCLVDGKSVVRWALIDFTDGERYDKLVKEMFIGNLKSRCERLGMRMDDPLVCLLAPMRRFSSAVDLENLLKGAVDRARSKSKENLQLIVCVMAKKDPGYKLLKWVSETKIGVLTQCCLSSHANKGQDQYLANLCLKINAKLGGTNFELMAKLPNFVAEDHVMFIGADVNHPAPNNATCPSIAAVVGTVNWPAANRYAARVSPQAHRQEKISNFGGMCFDLIKTYIELNRVRPSKIVIFRDGVSEGQFGMVLAEELCEIKNTIYDDHYQPKITLIVAQKRHQTRLFGESRNDVGPTGNVPPGTVVDTVIIHHFYFDFYLCSHYGGLGTSKPTHYHVLWDENFFSSDQLQKLIYDMCFTFARCTKPVSLVPPVYYADLVAYRGRMFQEAAMESEYHSSALSSSQAISPTSSSTALWDRRDYNLHPELENVMFFV